MQNIFFDSWESIVRTGVITILAYVLLVFLLRLSGKRTLSKMNAFDFIVTVALGSTLATVMLNKNVALADGVLGFFLLIFLQYGITYLAVRSKSFSKLIKSTPTLLLYKGKILEESIRKQRITQEEIHAALREKGIASLADAGAVVLETDGSLTVVKDAALETDVMNKIQKPFPTAETP
jgi:uncharacterized membrane protein YcaP (DUF421 family)